MGNTSTLEAVKLANEKYVGTIIKRLEQEHPSYAQEIKKRNKDHSKQLGVWYELMVYDWLWKLGKNPMPTPKASRGSKPDWVFTSHDNEIFVEVASVQESDQDRSLFYESERFFVSQGTSSFKTMRESFIKKAGQHRIVVTRGNAYVICLGLESPFIGAEDVRSCLIGNEVFDLKSGKLQFAKDGEIFETQDSAAFLTKYKSVSAILVAKRNYSIEDDKNKLDFSLILNPFAIAKISPIEFGAIPRFVSVNKNEMDWVY